MEQQVVLVLSVCFCALRALAIDHAELRGEHPNQDHIDNGQCVPIPCVMGVPPKECSRLCALRHYDTICKPPADFCLCRHVIDGKEILVSPDEMAEEPPESTPANSDENVVSYHFFAIFLPIKQYFEASMEYDDTTPQATGEPLANVAYESVNVHEGRLFWDFRYILTGLALLMIGLVLYELVLCALQIYGPKQELSVKCEPDVMVQPVFLDNEKILPK